MESNLEELFNSIENSSLYKEYKKMESILDKDKKIKEQIEEIKALEQEATHLEHVGDERYKEIDEEIKRKSKIIEDNPVYKEYLSKMQEFNKELSVSADMISDFVRENI